MAKVSIHNLLTEVDYTISIEACHPDVSIHNLLTEVDMQYRAAGGAWVVSIHNLLTEVDFYFLEICIFMYCFNSQPPYGG